MPGYIIYNGKLLSDDSPIVPANNRGLRYGDGLFETTRMLKGKIALFDLHMERLFDGLARLQFELPKLFSKELLWEAIDQLTQKNKVSAQARVRLTVIRGNGGLYDPENHSPNYIIEATALPDHYLQLNENGLIAGIYYDAIKSADQFSSIKSNNYLVYAMAALHAKKNKWNDCLVLNQYGRICDATMANVFWIKDNIIYTPPISEGCVDGVMRRYLMQSLKLNKHSVQEQPLTVELLQEADELFFTNAAYGMRWVKTIGEKDFKSKMISTIYQYCQ